MIPITMVMATVAMTDRTNVDRNMATPSTPTNFSSPLPSVTTFVEELASNRLAIGTNVHDITHFALFNSHFPFDAPIANDTRTNVHMKATHAVNVSVRILKPMPTHWT